MTDLIETLVLVISALIALLHLNHEAEDLLELATQAERVYLSTATRLELTLVTEGSRFNITNSKSEAPLSNLRL
ncbi:MAG: type II toxin-antitoxin system VapC family toxin [Vulcanococcus sp.]|uniref:type II toxin-antitoxin system VapC family toxin n=1 Tax=Vulcanococcus sp. TaxID=2856995 RepID=UPI0025E7805B|nr:type II toxin-antitoxin system VapC family toxin [Vulcanococcus sp.]MBW0173607.1 type II toxin-antitoxin system VapC family toxin [Vulcanococcus sp.]MBW0180944.1 type II toxin-antitoxin system VapC family toxin [Vulcanococcus sp.]